MKNLILLRDEKELKGIYLEYTEEGEKKQILFVYEWKDDEQGKRTKRAIINTLEREGIKGKIEVYETYRGFEMENYLRSVFEEYGINVPVLIGGSLMNLGAASLLYYLLSPFPPVNLITAGAFITAAIAGPISEIIRSKRKIDRYIKLIEEGGGYRKEIIEVGKDI